MFFSKNFVSKTKEYNSVDRHVPAPIMRKTFFAETDGEEFGIDVCGLGFYRIFINGKEIGKSFRVTYLYNPDDFLFYDRYELKEYVKKGKNAIAFILGNGALNMLDNNIWQFENAAWRSATKVAFTIFKGERIISEAEDVKCHDSPITFDDLRGGCRYDANKEVVNFADADFDDSGWDDAIPAKTPKGEPRECKVPPVKAIRKIKPVSVKKSPTGRYLYDFGENVAGVCELKINAEKGQVITLQYGEYERSDELQIDNITNYEKLHPGYIQKDVYVAKDGEQVFIPSFTYHGFKYVAVSGITDEQATKELLTCIVMHPEFKKAGEFSCDDPVVNKIQDAVLRSNLSNMVLVPTDCPHREKNGWTGDVALSAEQFFYNHKAEDFLRGYTNCVCAAQKEDGSLPGIVPTGGWGFEWGNGPGWDIVVPEVAYRIYQATGDKSVYEEVSDCILKYINYLETKKNENGLYSYGLGDWCEAGKIWASMFVTPVEITDTITIVYYYALAEKIFAVLGNEKMRERAITAKKELTERFRKVHVKGCSVVPESITGQAMALYYGIFTEEEKSAATKKLVELINADEYGMRVGVAGGRALFDALAENGEAELAYKLITKKEFPSYAYMVERYSGGTLWEAFNEMFDKGFNGEINRTDGERPLSFNHHFWGFVSTFFYKYIAGIRLIDVNTVEIKPIFINGVNSVVASHEFKSGRVEVRIKKGDGKDTVNVTVNGVNAIFIYPVGYSETGKKIKLNEGENLLVLKR